MQILGNIAIIPTSKEKTFLKYEANKLTIDDLKDCKDPLSETIVMMALCE